jgi:penicillin-binding protein 2
MVSLGRVTGAGLIINPQTGEVLSMISFPSFDNNNLTSQIFVDKNKPTFNRVISGLYSPGSTIKPLVAFGVLEENIIDPLKQILSIGYIDIPNPYYPEKPSRFLDWKPQGWVNLYSALARSSNIYFYEVGGGYQDQQGLGISRLIDYWKKFEIDKPTGVDLPGEVSGILADPQKREEQTGQIWRVGDTYNVVIGQGDLRITPIELLRYISSIADKGKTPIPYIVGSIKNSQSYIVYQARPEFTSVEAKDPNHFDEIEKGMLDGVRKDYGTSYSLHDIPMAIAAKTGSAQIQNNQKTNAFFVGYGPVPNPQIAVLILIEDAKEGSLNTVPVAKKVFEWYYENRIKKQK